MYKNYKNNIILFVIFIINACSTYVPIHKYKLSDKYYNEIGCRLGFEFSDSKSDIGSLSKIPIHEKDGGEERGCVYVNPTFDATRFIVGVENSFGTKKMRVKFGGDIKHVNGTFESKRNWRLQPLPSPYESYGYAYIFQDSKIYQPYLGLDYNYNILDYFFTLSFEYGTPISEFSFEKGHHRYNKHDPILRDSWSGNGESYKVKIVYNNINFEHSEFSSLRNIGFIYARENFDSKFGDISTKIKTDMYSFLLYLKF